MTLTGEFALKDHRLLVGGQDLVSERDGYLWGHKALLKHRFGFHCNTQNKTDSIQHVEKGIIVFIISLIISFQVC